jgi:hypothetical protein
MRCQHVVNNELCGTRVSFNRYTYKSNQYLFNTTAPSHILVGKSHLYDIHFVKQLAIAQLLHGNGTHLLAMQTKITNQHSSTPDVPNSFQGTKKLTPSNSSDNIALVIKTWMLLRYLSTHLPKPPNIFPMDWSIENIITHLQPLLMNFNLRKHVGSSAYNCHKNIYILDGTQKVTFKVCSVRGCMNSSTFKRSTCDNHKHHTAEKKTPYTGMTKQINVKFYKHLILGGIYNMLCECGCPVGMTIYKGGESFIEMINFAENTLKVYSIEFIFL